MIILFITPAVVEFCRLAGRRGFSPQLWAALVGTIFLTYAFFDPQIQILEVLVLLTVAVPVLSWGSLVRLVQDMATLAPPFSCGPCVTKECIENERAESAMAYLGLLERRVRGAASRG